MHITSGLSPASGEMLDASVNFYGDSGDQFGLPYFAVDHAVPESSHTVEIEYVYEQPETYTQRTFEVTTKEPKEKKKPPDFKKSAQKPNEMALEEEPETDLTNLNWLQNITNIMSVSQFPIAPMSPTPPLKPQPPTNTRLQKFNKTIAKCQDDFMENREEYQRNSDKKPPYSYSTLICMAMRYNNDKMTLSAIYAWIKENFKYYRHADPTWQNSIRHNLSLNKVFVKEARSKQEPGKGGFWKLDLGHLEGTKRVSNRPHKRKKESKPDETDGARVAEDKTAVDNIPQMEGVEIQIGSVTAEGVCLHMPEFQIESLNMGLDANVGANVIVEPAVPPPLLVEDDLTSLLLNPTDWDDLQLDMFDNYLDSCFK